MLSRMTATASRQLLQQVRRPRCYRMLCSPVKKSVEAIRSPADSADLSPGDRYLLSKVEDGATSDEEMINWADAMELIEEAERLFPPERPTEDERLDIFSSTVTYNLAKVVNGSPTLCRLLDMNVALWKWEKIGLMDLALQLDFDRDVLPRIELLKALSLDMEGIAHMFTHNGRILQESTDDLVARINYMHSMEFSKKEIVKILLNNPYWLTSETKRIDARLGFLQREFGLVSADVRRVAVRCPRLVTWGGLPLQVSVNKLTLRNACGFSEKGCKALLLRCPLIYMQKDQKFIEDMFSFLVDEIGYTKELIFKCPDSLIVPMAKVRSRPAFLHFLKRGQFDPTKPNYISLGSLMLTEDDKFCSEVAKAPLKLYDKFLRTR